jgi:hypothetical protein
MKNLIIAAIRFIRREWFLFLMVGVIALMFVFYELVRQ